MDQQEFDRIARVFGRMTTRRAGIGAMLAAMASPLRPASASQGEARPQPEGPCGNGSRKANVCTKGSQCCTGICRTGLKNRDGKGRCRCLKPGASCTEDRNCCNGVACVAGTCSAPCDANVCASGCRYQSVEEAWAALPAGSTITVAPGTWPVGTSVDKSMTVVGCGKGAILQVKTGSNGVFCPGSSEPVTLTLRGLTIQGTGSESGDQGLLQGDRHVSFDVRDCTFRRGHSGLYSLGDGPDAMASATIADCEFQMIPAVGAGIVGENLDLVVSGSTFGDSYIGVLGIASDLAVDGCTFTGQSVSGVYRQDGDESGMGSVSITNTSFSNATMAIFLRYVRATITGVTVSGSTMREPGKDLFAAVFLTSGTYRLRDVTISGNTSNTIGAGLGVGAATSDATVTLEEGVSITGNTALKGSGIAVIEFGASATVIGAPEAVKRNTGAPQCIRSSSVLPWTGVPDCAF